MDDGDTDEEFWLTQSESLSQKDEERNCLTLGANLEFAENIVVETSTTKRDEYAAQKSVEGRDDENWCLAGLVDDVELEKRIQERIPKNTRSTAWCENVWKDCTMKRNRNEGNVEDKFTDVPINIIDCSEEELEYWLAKFVLEVGKNR